MNKRIYLLFLVFATLAGTVYGIGISGTILRHYIDFEPGYTREDSYLVTSREDYTATYVIRPIVREGADLSPYLTITPSRIENVGPGESVQISVKLKLPDKIDVPGQSLTWVRVEIEPSPDAGFMAYPSVALSYYVFVLYPFKYLQWSFSAPNMNVNETMDFTASIENLGTPTIDRVYADVTIVSTETEETVRTLKTNTATNVVSREKRDLIAKFDSRGLKPGDYRATAVLYWDSNVSTQEQVFRIGTKHVKILNFTTLFEIDSINKMNIDVESAWNNRIANMYAEITVLDKESGQIVKTFKSLNTDLNPWEVKTMEAYFDTDGLEKKEYKIILKLIYEGLSTVAEGTIRIDENIGAVVVEEIPGTFSFKDAVGSAIASIQMMHILLVLLVVFILLSMYLSYAILKDKFKKEQIDPTIVSHIRELKQKYSDSYIKEMMLKKGWSEDKINQALKEAGKR